MENTRLIEIEVLSWSTRNPGVNYPGFCTIEAEGTVESPFFVTCFGKAKETKGSVAQDDYIVASGFTTRTVGSCIKAAVNSVTVVDKDNRMFALAGEYAFYYNLITKTHGVAGEKIIVSENLSDYQIIRLVAEDAGFHVSSLSEASDEQYYRAAIIGDEDVEKCRANQKSIYMVVIGILGNVNLNADMSIETCNNPGKGFDDERYQKGYEVYPEHYVRGMVKHNLLNACEYIEKSKIEQSESVHIISSVPEKAWHEPEKLQLRDPLKDDLLRSFGNMFSRKICPGTIELVDSTNTDIKNSLALLASIAMCGIEKTSISKNANTIIITGNLKDGSLFSVLKAKDTDRDMKLYLHYDSKTCVLDSNGLKQYNMDSDNLTKSNWVPPQISFDSFENSEGLETWKSLLKRVEEI